MLFLLFQLGQDRYALDASRVVEVVPLLTLKQFPRPPKESRACSITEAGLFRRWIWAR